MASVLPWYVKCTLVVCILYICGTQNTDPRRKSGDICQNLCVLRRFPAKKPVYAEYYPVKCLVYTLGMSSVHPRYKNCTTLVCIVWPRDVEVEKCELLHVLPRFPAKNCIFRTFFLILAYKKQLFRKKPGNQNKPNKKFFKSIALFWPISPYCEPHSSICQKKFAVFSIFQKMVSKKARRRPKSKKCHVFKVVDNEI